MCSSTHSLTSALDGGEWSVSKPGRFTPPPPTERVTPTPWKGGWVSPRAVLDALRNNAFMLISVQSVTCKTNQCQSPFYQARHNALLGVGRRMFPVFSAAPYPLMGPIAEIFTFIKLLVVRPNSFKSHTQ
jgi:hypothetical protein